MHTHTSTGVVTSATNMFDTASYHEYAPQSPTYGPSSPACDAAEETAWCNTAPAYMVVQQHENVEFIGAKEHERLVTKARYKGPDFTKPLMPQHKVAARKRIYGEEYCTLAEFNVEPQFKMIKLDQEQYELLTTNATTNFTQPTATTLSSADLNDSDTIIDDEDVIDGSRNSNTKRYANPTPTVRQSSVFKLTVSQIPKICMECLSTRCYCNDY